MVEHVPLLLKARRVFLDQRDGMRIWPKRKQPALDDFCEPRFVVAQRLVSDACTQTPTELIVEARSAIACRLRSALQADCLQTQLVFGSEVSHPAPYR